MVFRRWLRRRWEKILLPPKRVRPMGLVAVQMSINPFEFYLLVAVCIVGVLYLIGLPPPNSVAMLLPAPMVKLWAVNLGVGGLSAFIGGLWRRNLSHGLLAYQVGWVLVGVACLTYGLALLLLFPTTGGVYAGISNVLWSVACATRVVQVQRFFKLSEQTITNSGGVSGDVP